MVSLFCCREDLTRHDTPTDCSRDRLDPLRNQIFKEECAADLQYLKWEVKRSLENFGLLSTFDFFLPDTVMMMMVVMVVVVVSSSSLCQQYGTDFPLSQEK